MSPERETCPACGQLTIIPIAYDEIAEDTTCQNSDCRVVLNKEGHIIGRWTAGYVDFVRGREDAHV
jgi:hypothetical protein